MNIKYTKINQEHIAYINQIADWYLAEWSIPKHKTIDNLTNNSTQNIIFQLLMLDDVKPIGTGGLYNKVGIQSKIEKYKNYSPWVALMYTTPATRGIGFGAKLLQQIEFNALQKGFNEVYLFTHTAESLYKRQGWCEIDRYDFDDKNIVIMKKELK